MSTRKLLSSSRRAVERREKGIGGWQGCDPRRVCSIFNPGILRGGGCMLLAATEASDAVTMQMKEQWGSTAFVR